MNSLAEFHLWVLEIVQNFHFSSTSGKRALNRILFGIVEELYSKVQRDDAEFAAELYPKMAEIRKGF